MKKVLDVFFRITLFHENTEHADLLFLALCHLVFLSLSYESSDLFCFIPLLLVHIYMTSYVLY